MRSCFSEGKRREQGSGGMNCVCFGSMGGCMCPLYGRKLARRNQQREGGGVPRVTLREGVCDRKTVGVRSVAIVVWQACQDGRQ